MTSPESVEKPKKKIHLIYRDNDLFQSLVPSLVDEAGEIEFDIHVFNSTDTEVEIRNWLHEQIADLENEEILVDGTVRNQLAAAGCNNPKRVYSLDSLVYKATIQSVLGPEWNTPERRLTATAIEGKEKDIETTKKAFLTLLKNLLDNPEKFPKKVVIVQRNLDNHLPFQGEYFSDEVQTMLKEWLIEAGIPENIITLVNEITEEEAYSLDKDTWIVGDRHNNTFATSDDLNARKILMPIASLFQGLENSGDIKKNTKSMSVIINTSLTAVEQ